MTKIELYGCRPNPIGSYLKSLGILCLVSSDMNHVTKQAADPQAQGRWENETFILDTELNKDKLLDFFLTKYSPSPIITPWNKGGGFWTDGKIKNSVNRLRGSKCKVSDRFMLLSETINKACRIIEDMDLISTPSGDNKTKFISRLRSELPDEALDWLDTAVVLSENKLKFPPLLSAGGNDGHLDFAGTFARLLISGEIKENTPELFNLATGEPRPATRILLENSLFEGTPTHFLRSSAGQFMPSSTGDQTLSNPWDFIFLLEGVKLFSGYAASRFRKSNSKETEVKASFPFTVKSFGSGYRGFGQGNLDKNFFEIWCPLWGKSVSFCELQGLFKEGRAVAYGRPADDEVDYAIAAKNLGVNRGISRFQRFGWFERPGDSHFIKSIGSFEVDQIISHSGALMSDLYKNFWFKEVRSFSRKKESSASIKNAMKTFEDSTMAHLQQPKRPDLIQKVLMELGNLCQKLAMNSNWSKKYPEMSRKWVEQADDGSPEFRVAAALASLNEIPMKNHFIPVEGKNSANTVVWRHGDLVSNMIKVLERRIIEQGIRKLEAKPFGGTYPARLSDIAYFLEKNFDDKRCASLLKGLIWVQPYKYHKIGGDMAMPPLAYAALLPLFMQEKTLAKISGLGEDLNRVPIPAGMIARLRTDREATGRRTIDAQVREALKRCHASGLSSPFNFWQYRGRNSGFESSWIGVGVSPRKLAAALLIPVISVDNNLELRSIKKMLSKVYNLN